MRADSQRERMTALEAERERERGGDDKREIKSQWEKDRGRDERESVCSILETSSPYMYGTIFVFNAFDN